MAKTDLKQELKQLYAPSAKDFVMVDVPAMNFIMVDGRGDPNTAPAFQEAMEALFSVAYNVKFALKKAGGDDFAVMPLEGLWWAEKMERFSAEKKDDWFWTVMIAQPPQVTAAHIQAAVREVAAKKNPPALAKLRFESYHEGPAAQIMYYGPFADEGPTIARLHEYIAAQGYELHGKHHEIYLSDMRRTAPEKLRTVIRQPVVKRG